MISVVLLGAGNVGQHLYQAFQKSDDVNLVQWYNRNLEHLKPFANEVAITDNLEQLETADVYVICVSDDAISGISDALPFSDRLIVHTSGMSSVHDLNKKNKRGVFYPLQSFSAQRPISFNNVPVCIEALDKSDFNLLKQLATALGSTSYKINTEQRQTLHLSAVFVNNFSNQLYRIAHEISDAKNINFDILKPLIAETAQKVQEMSPYMAQTGPALRGDKKTIKRHLKLLKDSPHENVYELLTNSIKKTHGRR